MANHNRPMDSSASACITLATACFPRGGTPVVTMAIFLCNQSCKIIYIYICVLMCNQSCKIIYIYIWAGTPTPPPARWFPPPVAGEGGFSQQPSRLLLGGMVSWSKLYGQLRLYIPVLHTYLFLYIYKYIYIIIYASGPRKIAQGRWCILYAKYIAQCKECASNVHTAWAALVSIHRNHGVCSLYSAYSAYVSIIRMDILYVI